MGISAAAAFFSKYGLRRRATPDLGLNVIVSHGSAADASWSLANYSPYTTNPANSIWSFGWNVNVNPDPLINGSLTIVLGLGDMIRRKKRRDRIAQYQIYPTFQRTSNQVNKKKNRGALPCCQ